MQVIAKDIADATHASGRRANGEDEAGQRKAVVPAARPRKPLAAFSVFTLLFLRFLPSCVRQLTRSVRRPAARPGHRRSLKPGIQHPTLHRRAAILVWKLASHLKGSPDEAKTEFGENHSDGSTLTVFRCLQKSRLGGTRRTQLHLEG